jgi:hypothetical protein
LKKPQVGEEVKKFVATELPKDAKLDMSGWFPRDFERCRTAIDSFYDLLILKSEWMANAEQGIWDAIVACSYSFLSWKRLKWVSIMAEFLEAQRPATGILFKLSSTSRAINH